MLALRDWVIDLDIRGFFDNLDHELVLRAVRKYTQCSWILLYLKRWLEAPAQLEDGTLVPRTKGTPQGGVVSPLVANIFLHLAFDDWMRRVHPDVPFERYADDIVAHCGTETQAQQVLESIRCRLAQCRLEVHPEKTRIVYCKDDDRIGALSRGEVHLPRVHVPPSPVEESVGEVLRDPVPRCQQRRGEADATGNATLADQSAERQGHRRLGAHVEPSPSGLDPVLRSVLQVRLVLGFPTLQRTARPLGHEEIQKAATTPSPSRALARRHWSPRTSAFRPLAFARAEAGGWMMGAV